MSARVGSSPVGARRRPHRGALHPCPCPGAERLGQAEIPNHPFVGALISGLEPEPKPLRPRLEKPCGVTVTPEGAIYVSDYARQSVIGTSLTELFPENGPCGLAYDGNNLYVNEFHGIVVNTEIGRDRLRSRDRHRGSPADQGPLRQPPKLGRRLRSAGRTGQPTGTCVRDGHARQRLRRRGLGLPGHRRGRLRRRRLRPHRQGL